MNKTSTWYVMWKEIKNDKLALIGLFLFIGIVITVYVWAWQIDEAASQQMNLRTLNQAPCAEFRLGTDSMGRDVLTRLVLASRVSLNITFIVTFFSAIIGIVIGLVAGFYAGHVDNVIMRLIALWVMIPGIMLIIVFRTLLVPDMWGFSWMMIIIGGWLSMAGMVRVMALRQGRLDYVSASKTLGTPNIVIMFREVLPNLVSIITSTLTLNLASNMGLETGLTFLGFGLPPGTPSLGRLVSYARSPYVMQNRMWQWLPAALLIFILMLCVNFVGQALNRAADAKKRIG